MSIQSESNDQSEILVVGWDQMRLQVHRLILGTYFHVESAGRMAEAGALLSKRDFDLIVMGESLSDAQCMEIADMVQNRRPQPALLSLTVSGRPRAQSICGRKVYIDGGPLKLLKECADTLGFEIPGRLRISVD